MQLVWGTALKMFEGLARWWAAETGDEVGRLPSEEVLTLPRWIRQHMVE